MPAILDENITIDEQPVGTTIFAQHVDNLARTQPDKVFVSYAKTNNLSDGFRDVTWAVFANAVNRAAHWIDNNLPEKRSEFETLAYFGESDIRYFILVVAGNKTRYKFLLPSPRNSEEGQLNLLTHTDCSKLLHAESISVQSLLDAQPSLQSFVVPSLDELLDETAIPHYPYTKTYQQGRSDTHVIFHTSGSTGFPKPIFSPEEAVCSVEISSTIPDLNGKPYSYTHLARQCHRFFCNLPLFHAAGFILGLHYPAYFDTVAVLGPPSRPLSASLLNDMILYGNVQGLYGPPATLEEATKIPSYLENLSKLDIIICATGPLSSHAGAAVASRTHLSLCSGSTESYFMPTHVADPEDWRYLCINTRAGNIDWRKEPGQDLYELVYLKGLETRHVHAAFATFPDRTEFGTGDLFEKHPTKPDLWRLVGRRDDLLVLLTGEKVQPRPMEDIISGHKAVSSVIVFGHGRYQTGAVIELRQFGQEDECKVLGLLMDSVWAFVEKANQVAPAHARLLRHMVFFASPKKPFIRVGKGSISRPASIKLYQAEIDELYTNADAQVDIGMDININPADNDKATLLEAVHSTCEKAMQVRIKDDTTDFFDAGADSIGVLLLVSALKNSLQKSWTSERRECVTSRLVYENTNVLRLCNALRQLDSNAIVPGEPAVMDTSPARLDEWVNSSLAGICWNPKHVVLTGSTGSLGSYLLHTLLNDSSVDVVYCLNRRRDAKEAQLSSHVGRGLSVDFHKVVFLHADLAKQDLAIAAEMYQSMARNVKHIIHCAWSSNFHANAASFDPLVKGVANLARFASQSASNAPITFISTVGTVQNWAQYNNNNNNPPPECGLLVPETSHNDARLTATGYSLSKLAASMVLERVAREYGVRSLIIRAGQIAGPVGRPRGGSWPKHEWLPSLIYSSRHLGALPDSLGSMNRVNWIPVNFAAEAIWEMTSNSILDHNNNKGECTYLHLANPHVADWQDCVLPVLQKRLGPDMQVMSLKAWIALLKQSLNTLSDISTSTKQDINGHDPKPMDLNNIPALKLLSIFESYLHDQEKGNVFLGLSTSKAQLRSATIRNKLKQVDGEWVNEWLDQWEFGKGD